MAYHLGIDLGTTYTAAAVHEGSAQRGPEVVTLGERGPTAPSVLCLQPDGGFVAGDAAERHAVTEPQRIARQFKRRLGDPTPILVGEAAIPAEVLTGHLLHWVVDTVVRARGGERPASIVLTHPANWGPYKRDLLEKAAEVAGVTGVILVTEPQAAAISYASQERVDEGAVVAVYDLGGGTFDAAVLRKEADGGFTILGSPEGIERLGGIDVDAALFSRVTASVDEAYESLDPDDPQALAAVSRLRIECTQAKEGLSLDSEIRVPVLLPSVQTQVRVTRAELEEMIRPTLAETVTALERALRSAGLAAEAVDHVLLVGGSSRIPLVAELVSSGLGRPVAVDTHPKHAVALGAAIVAARAAGALTPSPLPAPPTAAPARPAPPLATGPMTPTGPVTPTGAPAPPPAAAAGPATPAPPPGYGQPTTFEQPAAYGQPGGYGQHDPPAQPATYEQPAPHGQPGAHEQAGSHGGPGGYDQAGSYGGPGGYGQPAAPSQHGAYPPPGGQGQPGGYEQSGAPGQPGAYGQAAYGRTAPEAPGTGQQPPPPGAAGSGSLPPPPTAPPPGRGPAPAQTFGPPTGGGPSPAPTTPTGGSGAYGAPTPGPAGGGSGAAYGGGALPPAPGASDDLPPGYLSGEAKAKVRKKGRRRARLGVLLGFLVLVGALGIGFAMTQGGGDTPTVADVAVGECFNGGPNDAETVACTEPHQFELIAVTEAPDPSVEFPGDEAVRATGGLFCVDAMETYYGATADVAATNGLQLDPIAPTEEQWDEGMTDTHCVARAADGGSLDVSIKGLGAAG